MKDWVTGGSAGPGGAFAETADIFRLCSDWDAEAVHVRHDRSSGLRAVVVIHDTGLGPGLGGCRFVPYPNGQAAMLDAMRLARGMSFKAAIQQLPYGGAKAVLVRPPRLFDRKAIFEAFGEFVEHLGGRFVTAPDSGTSVADMDLIARRTRHVTCTSDSTGDPSPRTALGVLRGIEAAVKARLGRTDLEGLRVVIQGVGKVGCKLAELLRARGAIVWVSDIDHGAVTRCVDEVGAMPILPEAVYRFDADVFAPCALGGAVNRDSVRYFHYSVVAGSANNQLAEPALDRALYEAGILYAPDYVINAGGLISAVVTDPDERRARIEAINDILVDLFERARRSGRPTGEVADQIALEALTASREAA